MPPSLRLLGAHAAVSNGSEERLPSEMPASLLVYLAVRGGWVDRRELAFLYRPDAREDVALAYLRKLVFRARRFDWASDLEVRGDALRWRVDTDVARFTAAVDAHDWASALDEYGGPFLGGASLQHVPGLAAWAEVERAALEARWFTASERRARDLEGEGRLPEAAAVHRAVLETDPFAETNLQHLVRLLATMGRRREALAAYESFRRGLATELGSQPLETTEALVDELRSMGQRQASGPAATNPIPSPGTPFVGRVAELERVDELFSTEGARIVTLVGLGGSGKTRLALELAGRVRSSGGDVAFVSLAAATSPGSVAAAVIDALALPWEDPDAESALVAGLRDRDILIVLDNFEGAIEAAPLVARLVEAAPALRVLVTSREPLSVYGEWVLDLGGLDAPAAGDDARAHEFGAVKLFVQQAARVAPGFAPGGAGLAAIAAICRRLEGLPLAIELAASWSRALSPVELERQLAEDASLLTSHRRDVAPRHRSLWQVFDHSWERLGPRERSALPKLALFREGFGLEAAQEVAEAGLETLLVLMDHKLVRRTAEGRFALHELVRQYALQHVGAPGELERTRDAHSRYYTSLLGRLAPALKGADVHAGLERVRLDMANFQAAWDRAVERADVAALDAARDALDYYFYYRSRFAAAVEAFARAVAALEALPGEARRVTGRLLLHQADHERHRGQYAVSQPLALRGRELLEEFGTDVDVAHAELTLAGGYIRLGSYPEAEERLRAVLEAARESGDDYLEGAGRNVMANLIVFTDGNVTEAEEHYQASLSAHRRLGNQEGIIDGLINLGACRYDLADLGGAADHWEEAAALAAELGHRQREAVLHNNLGSLSEVMGRREDARAHYEHSLKIRRELADTSGEANVLHNLGRLASAEGDLSGARRHMQESLRLYLDADEKAGIAHVRSGLARVLGALGRHGEARREAALALELALAIESRTDILGSLLTVAMLLEASGQEAGAARLAATVAQAAAGTAEPLRQEAEELAARAAGGRTAPLPDSGGADLVDVAEAELARLRPAPRDA